MKQPTISVQSQQQDNQKGQSAVRTIFKTKLPDLNAKNTGAWIKELRPLCISAKSTVGTARGSETPRQ